MTCRIKYNISDEILKRGIYAVQILLNKNKPFFKAAMHSHSTNSDGRLTVSEQKELFKAEGYSVVAFTDHEHLIEILF